MKFSEIFFILAGLGILVSFPLLGREAVWLWLLAKAFYFVGLVFFILRK